MHTNPSAESTSAASPIAKPSPSPVEAGTTEQPLDLSAKPSTTPIFSNDPKQVYRLVLHVVQLVWMLIGLNRQKPPPSAILRWVEMAGEATHTDWHAPNASSHYFYRDYAMMIMMMCIAVALFVHKLFLFFPFHFIFFALMCIAELHSKRWAITINLINCAEKKKNSVRCMNVSVCERK